MVSMRGFFIFAAMTAAVLCGCSAHEPHAGEIAGNAAKLYYDWLAEGKYDAYVDDSTVPTASPAPIASNS